MGEWTYLKTEVFRSRYAIAAYLIRNCEEIIEIGGYKTPITEFVNISQHKKITVIDPKLDKQNYNHLPITFQDWSGKPEFSYGIVILGLDLCMKPDAWDNLYKLINGSIITVVELSLKYVHAVNQFDRIKQHVSKNITMTLQIDLEDNEFNCGKPLHTLRKMYVLE